MNDWVVPLVMVSSVWSIDPSMIREQLDMLAESDTLYWNVIVWDEVSVYPSEGDSRFMVGGVVSMVRV